MSGGWYEVEVQHASTSQWHPLLDITVNAPWSAPRLKGAKDMRGMLRLTGKSARIVRVRADGSREVVS